MVVLSERYYYYYYYYHHHHHLYYYFYFIFLPGASIRYTCIILALGFDSAAARMGMLVGCVTPGSFSESARNRYRISRSVGRRGIVLNLNSS